MADSRNLITGASVAVAVLCMGWAIYVTKHAGASPGPGSGAGSRPAGAAGGGAQGGQSARPGNGGAGGQAVVVVAVPARSESISVGIEALGTAISNESVDVSSKTSNIVTSIHFTDGQPVRVGDVLVELDRAQASAELAAATADYTQSLSSFNRSRELLATEALSKAQHEQLEATMKANEARVAAARAKVADTYIRAPFSGRVGLRRVSLGKLINPGTVITTLDDTSSVKVDFSVPDIYVASLREGLQLVARSTAWPGREFSGRVLSVDSRIDPVTRAVLVRAMLPNRDAALKPGMFLTVELARERRPALLIPEEALVPEQARQFVFVVANGRVTKREVQIGRREPGRVEIAQGLREGERVVTEGTLKLREGTPVRELVAASTLAIPAS